VTLPPPPSGAPTEPPTTLTLTVDGELRTARPGATLLEVAREHGVAVPTLCELEGVSLHGGCRLCLVEVAGRPRPLAACVTLAEEGMVVETATAKLRRYRQLTLELLLAEGNHVCAVCVANGHCELQDLAAAHGVDHVEVDYLHPSKAVDASHPRFAIDHNRCVLCTRCVRACAELEGAHTWDMAGRGIASRVITDMAQPWGESATCTSCGKCVLACPTGALFAKGATVGEMARDVERLRFLHAARAEGRFLLELLPPGPGMVGAGPGRETRPARDAGRVDGAGPSAAEGGRAQEETR
jgi:bidirectional [NiFe] hydrogenase diaphorase subunit